MIVPVLSAGLPGTAVVQAGSMSGQPAMDPHHGWANDYASWLAARGTELFSWVTVMPAATFGIPGDSHYEERHTSAEEIPGGRDSLQRVLPLPAMSYDLRAQLTASQGRRQKIAPGEASHEMARRLHWSHARRRAMIRNLDNGYRYRSIVTHEALHDLVEHGQYTIERVHDNFLTGHQKAEYLHGMTELIRDFPNFDVLVITDDQLEQALPLGASWVIKRGVPSLGTGPGPASGYLPSVINGQKMAAHVVVDDALAAEGISRRIDALWASWADGRTREQIRQEALAELERAAIDLRRPG